MRAKFVLFAQGRTGSTLLGDLLRSHPEVYFADEILAEPVRSTRYVAERMRWRHARHAVGFHVKIYQLSDVQGVTDAGSWLQGMHRHGWRLITLRRQNLLRQVLSNMTAQLTNRYEDRSGDGEFVRVRPHINPDELLHWMGLRAAAGRDEAAALDGVPHLALSYEQDLQDASTWESTMKRVFGHLDLAPVPVVTNLRRQNEGELPSLIANYDEVKRAVTETEYARYLA
jgi:LPS sulfotransferase NodH